VQALYTGSARYALGDLFPVLSRKFVDGCTEYIVLDKYKWRSPKIREVPAENFDCRIVGVVPR